MASFLETPMKEVLGLTVLELKVLNLDWPRAMNPPFCLLLEWREILLVFKLPIIPPYYDYLFTEEPLPVV